MVEGLGAECVAGESPIAFLDFELVGARHEPDGAFAGADGAVAGIRRLDLGDSQGEFEGATVAVSMVGFEVFGHGGGGGEKDEYLGLGDRD